MADISFKKYAAEIIGTAVLVFMGCGSAVFLGCEITGGHLAVALAFGLSVVAMVYTIGDISGCHINPAVSLAALIDKRISFMDFCCYVFSQIIGGLTGAISLKVVSGIVGIDHTRNLGSNLVAGAGDSGGAFLVEVILTFIFVLTVLSVTASSKKDNIAGLIIGLTFVFVHIVGIPLTGTSVNPARSIGPAAFTGGQALADLWVFVLAPFTGAALAAFTHKLLKHTKDS